MSICHPGVISAGIGGNKKEMCSRRRTLVELGILCCVRLRLWYAGN